KYDRKFGSLPAYTVRLVTAFLILFACLIAVPFGGQVLVLSMTAIVGVFDSVGYGAMSQIFSLFPPKVSVAVGGKALQQPGVTVTFPQTGGFYFIGANLTSVLSIALSFATGFFDITRTELSVKLYFGIAAVFPALGLAAAMTLLLSPIGYGLTRQSPFIPCLAPGC
ncbi:unnamed protein product, partial [Symbiodinium sp. KB8]